MGTSAEYYNVKQHGCLVCQKFGVKATTTSPKVMLLLHRTKYFDVILTLVFRVSGRDHWRRIAQQPACECDLLIAADGDACQLLKPTNNGAPSWYSSPLCGSNADLTVKHSTVGLPSFPIKVMATLLEVDDMALASSLNAEDDAKWVGRKREPIPYL
jgi:hypothetical protein